MWDNPRTEALLAAYANNATIQQLMSTFQKSEQSIIAKLSVEKVYKPKIRLSSVTGNKPKTKLEYVANIENTLNLELKGLEKAPKTVLVKLISHLSE